MSDTLKQCEYCGKEFTAKRSTARFDSTACKLKFNRETIIQKPLVTEVDEKTRADIEKNYVPRVEFDSVNKELSEHTFGKPISVTSRKGGAAKGDLDWPNSPDWWVYGTAGDPDKTWNRVCVRCGEDFTTPLELMRFCSDLCKKEVMVVVANGPHKKFNEAKEN